MFMVRYTESLLTILLIDHTGLIDSQEELNICFR